MKKSLVALCLAGLSIVNSVNAEEMVPVCVSDAYGEYQTPMPGMNTNSALTPAFYTTGNGWVGGYFMTNLSDHPITVKLEMTDANGNAYTPYSLTYVENFSASNTPINLSQGAVLQPGQLGELIIRDPGVRSINVGKITWESDMCLENPLMVTLRNTYNVSGKIQTTNLPINGGLPF